MLSEYLDQEKKSIGLIEKINRKSASKNSNSPINSIINTTNCNIAFY